MEKIAFKMKLYPGMKDEYKKRHDEIWSELSELLVKAGVRDYSIFLDQDTNFLFAVMWREEDHKMDQLRSELIMKKCGEEISLYTFIFLLALVLLSPLLLLVSLLVRWRLGAPVIFSQQLPGPRGSQI